MPQRQRTFKVVTEQLQGADSFVIFNKIKYERRQAVARVLEDAPRDAGGKIILKLDEQDDIVADVLRESIAAWNWVDDDGVTLPTPAEGLSLTQLLDAEVNFLFAKAIGADDGNLKN